MNIKRLFILTGTVLLGLTLVSIWMSFLYAPPETAHAAGPWYVAPGGSDSNSCLSTAAHCATINGAIGKATGGDTIYVAIGTYTGTGVEVVLIDKDITLSGGWDITFTSQSSTSTIDGEDARRGITVNSGITTNIDRFTVQNGYIDDGNGGDGNGGGIHNSGNLTVTNSIINRNHAEYSGYAYHGGGGIFNIGTLTVINSSINTNSSSEGGGGILGLSNSSTVIMDSQIYANTAIDTQGGGVEVIDSNLSILSTWVIGNAALDNDGGGISTDNGSVYIENSIIAGNFTNGTGGGLWLDGGPYHIINSNIVGNKSNEDGAAIAGHYAQIEIANTLVISNVGSTGFDCQGDTEAEFLLSHCDTYGNSPDGTVSVSITRTNCLGKPPEDGLDPLMAGGTLPSGVGPDFATEWLNYDYRLQSGSPAIDAGTPTGAPATDIEGTSRDSLPDMGAYEWGGNRIYLPVVTR